MIRATFASHSNRLISCVDSADAKSAGAVGHGSHDWIVSQLIVGPLFHEHRILCQVAGHRMNVVKALPALVVEEREIRRFAAALEEVVARAERVPSAFMRFGIHTGRRLLTARRQPSRGLLAS